MAKTNEVTAYYIRTRHGETFYVDTLAEALEEFVGDEGYRLTLSAGKNEVVIRRGVWVESVLAEKTTSADLTYGER